MVHGTISLILILCSRVEIWPHLNMDLATDKLSSHMLYGQPVQRNIEYFIPVWYKWTATRHSILHNCTVMAFGTNSKSLQYSFLLELWHAYTDHVKRKDVFEHARNAQFGSSSACTNYPTGLCFPFIHSVLSNDSVSGQRRSWSDCAEAQADLGVRMAWPK